MEQLIFILLCLIVTELCLLYHVYKIMLFAYRKLTFQTVERIFHAYVSKLINTVPFIKKDINFKGKNTRNRKLEIFESLFGYQIMLRMGCKPNRINTCFIISINFFRVMGNIYYPQETLSICMSILGSRKILFFSSHRSKYSDGFDPLLLIKEQTGY
jgi:hypothetical protein